MTDDEYTEAFSAVCDVVERNYHGFPLEGDCHDEWCDLRRTSKEAREAAGRIFDILGIIPD